MLTEQDRDYLDKVLTQNPTVRPRCAVYDFGDHHVPKHRECQHTAMHLETVYGLSAQIGIQWLEKENHLFPWPHVVNSHGTELVDYSFPIVERKLAFTLIGNDVEMANQITRHTSSERYEGSFKDDPNLQFLHDKWYTLLSGR